jgi:hypothetical protein
VQADDGSLLFGESRGLEQDGVGRAYLAYVMEECGERNLFEHGQAQPHAAPDGRRIAADAPRVAVNVAVFPLKRVGDGADDALSHLLKPTRETPVRFLGLVTRPVDLVVLQGAHDRQPEVFAAPGLRDVAVDLPAVDGADERLGVRLSGEDDFDHVRAQRRRVLKKLDAGHAGQALVCYQQRHVVLFEQAQRLLARPRAEDVVDVS